jgi:hypothetical protein
VQIPPRPISQQRAASASVLNQSYRRASAGSLPVAAVLIAAGAAGLVGNRRLALGTLGSRSARGNLCPSL